MSRLIVFNSVTLDGFFTDQKGDMSWAHKNDAEWNAFVSGNAQGECILVFGRVTYEMMAGWWPSPQAMKVMPAVAERMNNLPKVVFSRKLEEAKWTNTKLEKGELTATIRKMKKEARPDLMIFGSGTIVSQLAEEGLIDEYQLALSPIVLGQGRTMFATVKKKLDLKLKTTRTFGNGTVFLCYEPAG